MSHIFSGSRRQADKSAATAAMLPAIPNALRAIFLGTAAVCIVFAGGCSKISSVRASLSDVTGSISKPETRIPESQLEIRNYLVKWEKRYQANPNDKLTARSYALALRAAKRSEQAVAVLQKAVLSDPKDNNLLADYGKALTDVGKFRQAAEVLERAQTPEQPSWSIASAQGSVADQIGNHALAQEYYKQALKIAPGEPRVLSNLGLSYALSRDLPKAEKVMRQAAAHPRADTRVLQNLSLVLALQGKFEEAENLQRQVLPASDARANIMAIRRMISQSNTWREISAIDARKRSSRKNRGNSARRPRG